MVGGGGGGVPTLIIDEGEGACEAREFFATHTHFIQTYRIRHGGNHLHSLKFLFPGYFDLNVVWGVPRRIRYAIETRAT